MVHKQKNENLEISSCQNSKIRSIETIYDRDLLLLSTYLHVLCPSLPDPLPLLMEIFYQIVSSITKCAINLFLILLFLYYLKVACLTRSSWSKQTTPVRRPNVHTRRWNRQQSHPLLPTAPIPALTCPRILDRSTRLRSCRIS